VELLTNSALSTVEITEVGLQTSPKPGQTMPLFGSRHAQSDILSQSEITNKQPELENEFAKGHIAVKQSVPALFVERRSARRRSSENSFIGAAASTKGEAGMEHAGIAEREGLAHDACNLLAAVGLYCDLMSQPGVVNDGYQRYLDEMRKLAQRSEGLIERMMPRKTAQRPGTLQQQQKNNAVGLDIHQSNDFGSYGMQMQGSTAFPYTHSSTGFDGAIEVVAKSKVPVSASQQENNHSSNSLSETNVGLDAADTSAETVDVAKVLADSRDMLQVLAGTGVLVEVESQLPQGVQTDISEEALLRILVNLTVNARDAMPRGGRLRVTAQWDQAMYDSVVATPKVLISVQDTGAGMPEELVEAINQLSQPTEGQQLPGAGLLLTTSQVAGSQKLDGRLHGLGLEIVRELVSGVDGQLRVLSERVDKGIVRGTRFEISLPIAASTNAAHAATAEAFAVAQRKPVQSTVCFDALASNMAIAVESENDHATIAGTSRGLQLVSIKPVSGKTKRRNGQLTVNKSNRSSERGRAIC